MLNCVSGAKEERSPSLYSIVQLGTREVLRTGLELLGYSGKVQTAFVERANLTLREMIAPLSRRTWSIAHDRHRTPAMAANLVRYRWSVRDLLQLPVPEGVWITPFAATCRCR